LTNEFGIIVLIKTDLMSTSKNNPPKWQWFDDDDSTEMPTPVLLILLLLSLGVAAFLFFAPPAW
jgi:hypothetical protein